MKTKNMLYLIAALFCAATLTTTLSACGDDEEDPDPSWWADGGKKPGSNPDDPNNPGSNPDDPNNPGSTPDNPNNPGSNPDDPNNPGSNPDNPNNPGSNPDNPNNPGSNPDNPNNPGSNPDTPNSYASQEQVSIAMQLLSGGTRTLQLPNYGGDQSRWYSNNPEVATVDQEGRATGLSTGRAIITADGHVRGTFYVQVVDPSTILTLSAGPTSSDGNVLFFSHTDITNWYDDVITLTDIVFTNGTQEGTTEYHGLNEVLQPTRYNISAVMNSGFGRNQAQQPGQNILPFSAHFQIGSMPWAIITFTYNNKTFTINTEVQFQ